MVCAIARRSMGLRPRVNKNDLQWQSMRRGDFPPERFWNVVGYYGSIDSADGAASLPTVLEAFAERAVLVRTLSDLPPATLITSGEAAAYLGTSMGVLANWRSLRHGPRYWGSGGFIRYRIGDLDSWMSDRAREVPLSVATGSDRLTSQGNPPPDMGNQA